MGQKPIPSYMDVGPGGWVWVLSSLTSYNQSRTLSDSASLSRGLEGSHLTYPPSVGYELHR